MAIVKKYQKNVIAVLVLCLLVIYGIIFGLNLKDGKGLLGSVVNFISTGNGTNNNLIGLTKTAAPPCGSDDLFTPLPAGTVCNKSTNDCKNDAKCNGSSLSCPTQGNKPNGTNCGDTITIGEGLSYHQICRDGKCIDCGATPSGADGDCIECKLLGSSPYWDMTSQNGNNCSNTAMIGGGYGGKGLVYYGVCLNGNCKKCDPAKAPVGSNGNCLKCNPNGTWNASANNGSSCKTIYGFFPGQCNGGKCLAKTPPTGIGNPSTTSGFSAYIVRDKNSFSFNGAAYVVTPHVTLAKKATVTMNYASFPGTLNPETYKSEDERLILDSCKNSVVSAISKSIGSGGGVINFGSEVNIAIPASALTNDTNFTITKYTLSNCPNADGGVCAPKTCSQLAKNCGSVDDGCKGVLNCGSCTTGKACTNGTCVAICTPKTCAQLGKNCGSVSDGCNGILNCGNCAIGKTCTNGICSTACTPKTCFQLGKNCGSVDDSCGGTLNCGTCGTGQTCNNGACVENSINCIDSDGGLDYATKGIVSYKLNNLNYIDACTAGGDLIEYYCKNDAVSMIGYKCPTGKICLNGVCVPVIVKCQGADINKDGRVDAKDFAIMWQNYMLQKYDNKGTRCVLKNYWCNGADINKDGMIDYSDIGVLINLYNKSCTN